MNVNFGGNPERLQNKESSMAAYLIGQIIVKDSDLWQEYVAGVQESIAPFESEIVFRGKRSAVLAGENERDLVVVIKFAERSTLDNWFHSEKYQSLIALRDQAADVVITTYDTY
jgi:uncharacterized protein (DUF1330 family)